MSHDPPESGVNAESTNGAQNRASSAATTKSLARAMFIPRPIAHPLTETTIGV